MATKGNGPRRRVTREPGGAAEPSPPENPAIERESVTAESPLAPQPEGAQATIPSSEPGMLGVAGATSRIVQQAASILEEEISAGIDAARRVEERFIDVQKIRAKSPEEIMQRFRRDSHEVVDILVDLVSLATNSVGGLAQRAIKINITSGGMSPRSPTMPTSSTSMGIPMLQAPLPIKSGEAVDIPMTLENDSEDTTETFHFMVSELISSSGDRIEGQQVSFSPSTLVIGPRQSATVTVTVSVPEGTEAGVYSGLLQAQRLEKLRAVIAVQIA